MNIVLPSRKKLASVAFLALALSLAACSSEDPPTIKSSPSATSTEDPSSASTEDVAAPTLPTDQIDGKFGEVLFFTLPVDSLVTEYIKFEGTDNVWVQMSDAEGDDVATGVSFGDIETGDAPGLASPSFGLVLEGTPTEGPLIMANGSSKEKRLVVALNKANRDKVEVAPFVANASTGEVTEFTFTVDAWKQGDEVSLGLVPFPSSNGTADSTSLEVNEVGGGIFTTNVEAPNSPGTYVIVAKVESDFNRASYATLVVK